MDGILFGFVRADIPTKDQKRRGIIRQIAICLIKYLEEIMTEELIGIKECRDLRMYIHEFTKCCVLTKGEYRDIMKVLGRVAERLEESGQVIPEN